MRTNTDIAYQAAAPAAALGNVGDAHAPPSQRKSTLE
jgi:hypothetical protein